MTTLREEITEIIQEHEKDMLAGQNKYPEINESYVKTILNLFEKRIKKLRKKYPENLYGAYNGALDDIMEMLKK